MFTAESSYIELLNKFPPRPIKTEAELCATQKVIDALIDSGEVTVEKQDYLNLLGILVHEYEEKHIAMPDLCGIELLSALLEEFDLSRSALIPIFETEAATSEVLNGQRQLTVEQIEKLASFFHLSPSAFFSRRYE